MKELDKKVHDFIFKNCKGSKRKMSGRELESALGIPFATISEVAIRLRLKGHPIFNITNTGYFYAYYKYDIELLNANLGIIEHKQSKLGLEKKATIDTIKKIRNQKVGI